MAQVGDKYIIEIGAEFKNQGGGFGEPLYLIKGFRSLVFDENGLFKLEKYDPPNADDAYRKGAEDAWNAIRSVAMYREVKNAEDIHELIHEHQTKIDFNVGDEIMNNEGIRYVVMDFDSTKLYCYSENGMLEEFALPANNIKKTGRFHKEVGMLVDNLGCDVRG